MNFFILYVALPALFYRILAKTPFKQLNKLVKNQALPAVLFH